MKTVIAIFTLIFATLVSAETCMPTQNIQLREVNGKHYMSVDYREPTPTTIEVSYVESNRIDIVFSMVMNKMLANVEMNPKDLLSNTNSITLVYERQGNNVVCEKESSELDNFVKSTTQWLIIQKEKVKAISKGTAIKTADFLYNYASNNE